MEPLTKKETINRLKKNEHQLPSVITNMTLEQAPSSLGNLLGTIEHKLTGTQLAKIKDIGHSIGSIGLSIDDSCLKARMTKDELDNLIIYVPELKAYLRLKQIEYKSKLLEIITKQATQNGDVKIATWLLEKHYAEEYDGGMKRDMAKMQNNKGDDVMEMAIAFIRRTNSNSMPVHEHAGLEEKREEKKIYDIKDIIT